MSATVIDTLRLADRLKEAGFEGPQAEGMARALGDELAERMLTRRDLQEALRPIDARFDAMESNFDARFGTVDARFDAMEGKFDASLGAVDARFDAMEDKFDARLGAVDARFDAMEDKFDTRLEAVDARFDAMEDKFDTRFDAMGAEIHSVHRELSGKFNVLVGVMALGFTLLASLGGYNAMAPRFSPVAKEPYETLREETNLPVAPLSLPLAGGKAPTDAPHA